MGDGAGHLSTLEWAEWAEWSSHRVVKSRLRGQPVLPPAASSRMGKPAPGPLPHASGDQEAISGERKRPSQAQIGDL